MPTIVPVAIPPESSSLLSVVVGDDEAAAFVKEGGTVKGMVAEVKEDDEVAADCRSVPLTRPPYAWRKISPTERLPLAEFAYAQSGIAVPGGVAYGKIWPPLMLLYVQLATQSLHCTLERVSTAVQIVGRTNETHESRIVRPKLLASRTRLDQVVHAHRARALVGLARIRRRVLRLALLEVERGERVVGPGRADVGHQAGDFAGILAEGVLERVKDGPASVAEPVWAVLEGHVVRHEVGERQIRGRAPGERAGAARRQPRRRWLRRVRASSRRQCGWLCES